MATFGYTTIGGSNFTGADSGACRAMVYAGSRLTAGAADTVYTYYFYGKIESPGTIQPQICAYTFSGGVPVTRTGSVGTTAMSVGGPTQWYTASVSTALTNGVVYVCAVWFGSHSRSYYDTVASSDSRANNPGLPATWAQTLASNERYSVYADTTPVGHVSSMIGSGGGLIGEQRGLIA